MTHTATTPDPEALGRSTRAARMLIVQEETTTTETKSVWLQEIEETAQGP